MPFTQCKNRKCFLKGSGLPGGPFSKQCIFLACLPENFQREEQMKALPLPRKQEDKTSFGLGIRIWKVVIVLTRNEPKWSNI